MAPSHGPGAQRVGGRLVFARLGRRADAGEGLRGRRVCRAQRGQDVGDDGGAELRATPAEDEVNKGRGGKQNGDREMIFFFFPAGCNRAIGFASAEVRPLMLQEEGANYC